MKKYDVIVIGTGASGYSCACNIKKDGRKSVCIITENTLSGTSRNTGSDKQTYYKLSLGGEFSDSVRGMASDLFSGGCVDGDNALCEAALSAKCFYNLCELGIPFPCNSFGEYIGYKTDHDPYARATSAGPLTSKFMTEALEKQAKELNIEIYDKYMAIEILKKQNRVCGLVCFNISTNEFEVFSAKNIVLATGGPAGIYKDSVYPDSQNGFTSLATNVGASLQNFTEWQYGLASVNPKWNVSGTYMQVLPRFVSVDENGNEYEFLSDYFTDIYDALSMVFLKGYQWPFDINKVNGGSSIIDLLVYREQSLKGRRVYLDFTKNPFNLAEIKFDKLSDEAYTYLKSADALLETPIKRLAKMNMPAIELYKNKGLDLSDTYLEIALCAQHCNGGISVDKWWQTEIKGLFAIGECAGTHGIKRPGGSALNAGQVGALRASLFICESKNIPFVDFDEKSVLKKHTDFIENSMSDTSDVEEKISVARKEMSMHCSAIRNIKEIKKLIKARYEPFSCRISDASQIPLLYRYRDILSVQLTLLKSIDDYYKKTRTSRGSALYTDDNGTEITGLEEVFRYNISEHSTFSDEIQEINSNEIKWRKVRAIPENDECFENIWKKFRENKVII